ncbi:MAG: hypothetical protein QM736_18060 [Vicinamibacterales bacterium]
MRLVRATLPTPVGSMLALASDEALCALEFRSDTRMTRLDARLMRFFATPAIDDGTNAIIERTRAWLEAVLRGSGGGRRIASAGRARHPLRAESLEGAVHDPSG